MGKTLGINNGNNLIGHVDEQFKSELKLENQLVYNINNKRCLNSECRLGEILEKGAQKARQKAAENMSRIRKAIGIDF